MKIKLGQCQMCLEEIHVIALERFLIPAEFKTHPKLAREKAIKLLVTSATKGAFPKFILENFEELHIRNNDNDFVKKFDEGLKNGKIQIKS